MKQTLSIVLIAAMVAVLSAPMGATVYASREPISISGDFDFGEGSGIEREFTIQVFVSGEDVLELTGTPSLVQISGEGSSAFTVTQPTVSRLISGSDTTTFKVRFEPNDNELKTATIVVSYKHIHDGEEYLGNKEITVSGTRVYSGGAGTESSPYLISTADDLTELAEKVNGERDEYGDLIDNTATTYGGVYFKMTNDIALNSNAADYKDWAVIGPANTWTPIGRDFETAFSGNFDGNNHKVSGIYMIEDDAMFHGLFGACQGCTIQNLGVVDSRIGGGDGSGSIAGVLMGTVDSPTILKNCYNTGIVSGSEAAGGIFGAAVIRGLKSLSPESEKTIIIQVENCTNRGSVSGPKMVGGITGGINSERSGKVIIDSCTNYGDLSFDPSESGLKRKGGRELSVGGIVGYNVKGLIVNCGTQGTINVSAPSVDEAAVGGVVGFSRSQVEYDCVLNNYSTDDITVEISEGYAVYAGGISGLFLDDCVNNYFGGTITTSLGAIENQYIGCAFGMVGEQRRRIAFEDEVNIGKNYYDISKKGIGIYFIDSDTLAEGIAIENMTRSSGDDSLVTKLNNGIPSASAILLDKGYTGITPSAWYINSSLNNGYPQFTARSSSGGGGGGGKTDSASILVNNKAVGAGILARGTENGRTVTTVTLDHKALEERLKTEGQGSTVTIPVRNDSDIVRGELNGQMVKDMEKNQAVLQIKTDTVQYTLPAGQIDIDAISKQIGEGVSLSDIKVQVQIANPADTTVKAVEDAAKKGFFALVVPPVEFDIKCTYGGKTVGISRFNSYVERAVAIPDGVDPQKITTGIVVDADGTVHHVPTKVTKIDGKYYAVINSLTNSVYSVVYNPVEFADVKNHWAKDAVNDMGSRMVISGIGNGNFEPDRDITRAEFAAIMVRALGLASGEGKTRFTDVSDSAWYAGYVETAVSYGIINGFSDTAFAPDSKITREQAMAMIARAMKLTGLQSGVSVAETAALLEGYGDAGIVSGYAKESIAECLKNKVVAGRTASTVAPKDNMTRAEVATVIQRLLQKSELI